MAAITDYVRAYAGQIAPYLDKTMTILGTDGFGRSADRQSLRAFFEVDKKQIALAAIESLVRCGQVSEELLAQAIEKLDINPQQEAPWHR